jgi:hypothetical protein
MCPEPAGLSLHSTLTMRRTLAAITALTLSALLVVPMAGAKSTRKRSCPAKGRHALVANAQAEIYEAEGPLEKERFACAYAAGHPYALGPKPEFSPSGGGGIEREILAGHMVAYEDFAVGEYNKHWDVVVRNLWTGKVLRTVPSQGGFVLALVMKANGSAAWIVATEGDAGTYSVVVSDTTGTHVVATGSIEPKSLAVAGNTLYWTESGRPMSALLK